MSHRMEEAMRICADLCDRLGCTTTLGGHLGVDHHVVGANFVAKRERGMEQRRRSLINIDLYILTCCFTLRPVTNQNHPATPPIGIGCRCSFLPAETQGTICAEYPDPMPADQPSCTSPALPPPQAYTCREMLCHRPLHQRYVEDA